MSAWSDLKTLPEIIRFDEVVRLLDASIPGAKLKIHRWKQQGYIRSLGPRAGVYFNLVRCPNWEHLLPSAVALAVPSAVLIGPSVLHHYGWTTQIPRTLHVATPSRPTLKELDGVTLHRRPRSWYAAMQVGETGHSVYGLPALTPDQALLDGEQYPDIALDPDDLDEEAIADWRAAHSPPTASVARRPRRRP